jgi:eukaryotic-like serine/threonine-protein kinase
MKPVTDPEVGGELDQYRIEALVAESPMASIFRATDTTDGKTVAIKIPNLVMEEDPVRFGRFQREEEIGLTLEHPNVMRIFADRSHSRPYIVMEWCSGHILRKIMEKEGKLPSERAIKITLGVLHALEYIHNRGIIHRDLKPENIMVDDQDNIKLIDFGIASLEGAKRLTYTGYTQALGTPEYISPEQVKGKRGDARADLYALGVMLYEMLIGRTPFSGPSPLAVMNDRLMSHPFPPRKADPGISPALEEVLYRALEREPKNRYRSAHDFAWDLEHLDQVGIAAREELTEWRKPRATTHGNALIYSALALIPILVLLAVLFFTRHHN